MPASLASVQHGSAPPQDDARFEGCPRPSADGDAPAFFFAHSEAMRAVWAQIEHAAATDATVLFEGESGTGKTLAAYALHARSGRGARPLVKVSCAALPAELLESELFGHERGAFTGAHRRKPGKFELADEGTLLLDEVGELAPPVQAKLLHILQDGEFAPLGGNRNLRVNVRVLAATNRQLSAAVAAGTFRADLYYRLNVVRLEIPPLRVRQEEIPILAEHFLRTYAARYNRPLRSLTPETMALFLTYTWPGNVRELENLVKRIVLLDDEAGVRAALQGEATPTSATATLDLKAAVRRATRQVERSLIAEALRRTHGNRGAAARLLNISPRALVYKLRGLGDLGGGRPRHHLPPPESPRAEARAGTGCK